MAAHAKSVDGNHMLSVGLEGFYGGGARVQPTCETKRVKPNVCA
jgi:hypothetical protein